MVIVALLTIPAFYLEMMVTDAFYNFAGKVLSWIVFVAFGGELAVMLAVCRQRMLYLASNWLGVLLVVFSGIALFEPAEEFIPLLRLLRVAFVGIILMNVWRRMARVVSRDAIPYLTFLATISLGGAGAVFYWIEPTVHSYADGLWLAFGTGATVGYGDLVPTTPASKVFAVLMVVVGYAFLSLITASFAALFIGEDERKMRHLLQRDVKLLQNELDGLRRQVSDYHETVKQALIDKNK